MRYIAIGAAVLAALGLAIAGCRRPAPSPETPAQPPSYGGATTMPDLFSITSSAFAEGARIPTRYTGDGEDLSPPLSWQGVPEGTVSFALVMDDPDAPRGTFTHWVLYNLPAERKDLSAGMPTTKTLADLGDAAQGLNDFGKIGYGGPAPPRGPAHHYRFTIYALNARLDLAPGVNPSQLDQAMQKRARILGQARLVGTYGR
jgi:hypothetical protein